MLRLLLTTLLSLSLFAGFSQCPTSIFVGNTDNCHVKNFEIGSNTGNPVVTWNFGDGSQVTTGHYVQHNYLLPGVYVVTAVYTNANCPGSVTLTAAAEVTCNCTPVSSGFISNTTQGGPSFVNWSIATIGGSTFDQGVCQFSANDPECSANLCLEDGCYRFSITAPNSLLTNVGSFENNLLVNGQEVEIFNEEYASSNTIYRFSFSVNSNCGNCNLNVAMMQQSPLVLTASGFPENAEIHWTQNGQQINVGATTTFLLQPGPNMICATYTTPACSEGITWCETFNGPQPTECPEQLIIEQVSCGNYLFSAPPITLNQYVQWHFSDGETEYNLISESDAHVSHQFTTPGTHVICGVYHSMVCPSIELCRTIYIETCNEPCSLELDVIEVESGVYEFTATGYPEEYPMHWNFGDGHFLDATWVVMHEFAPGTYEVCASTETNACGLQTACTTITVPEIETPCNIHIEVLESACEFLYLTAGGIGGNNNVLWKLDGENHGTGSNAEFHLNPGTHEICAYYLNSICGDQAMDCQVFEIESCAGCSPVTIGIDSYVANGGTPSLYYSIIDNEDNTLLSSGVAQYSNSDPYFDFAMCLPDGCYKLIVDNNNEIQLGEGVFVFLNIDGESLPYEVIQQDGVSFVIAFGVNSDCSTSCEASFEVVPGDVPGVFSLINTSPNTTNAQWTWNYGNGQFSNGLNGTQIYTEPGVYEVCLTQYLPNCSSTHCETIEVTEPPACLLNDIEIIISASYPSEMLPDYVTALLTMNGLEFDSWDLTMSGEFSAAINLCVPDGCYNLQFNAPAPLLALFVQATVLVNGEPVNTMEILQGATSGNLSFNLNSDCTTNIETAQLSALKVFPNPANDQFTIVSEQAGQTITAELFDATGKKIMSTQSSSGRIQWSVADLSAGLYILKVDTGEHSLRKQLIIQH